MEIKKFKLIFIFIPTDIDPKAYLYQGFICLRLLNEVLFWLFIALQQITSECSEAKHWFILLMSL